MSMTEQNARGLFAWWDEATSGQQFEFQSPFAIEQCSEILAERSERGKGQGWLKNSRQKLLIRVSPVNENMCEIYMHRDAGRNLIAEVMGVLERQGATTLVRGEGRVGAFTVNFSKIFLALWTVMVCVITVGLMVTVSLMAIFLLAIILLPAIVIFILLQISLKERNNLLRLLHDILGA